MKPFSQTVIEQYIAENMEDSRLIDLEQLGPYGLKSYFYDELADKEIKGFLFPAESQRPAGKNQRLIFSGKYEKIH